MQIREFSDVDLVALSGDGFMIHDVPKFGPVSCSLVSVFNLSTCAWDQVGQKGDPLSRSFQEINQ